MQDRWGRGESSRSPAIPLCVLVGRGHHQGPRPGGLGHDPVHEAMVVSSESTIASLSTFTETAKDPVGSLQWFLGHNESV